MNWYLQLVSPPAVEPLTLEQVKIHRRIDVEESVEDELLERLIRAARIWTENFTSHKLIHQDLDLLLPGGFPLQHRYILSPQEIRLPLVPVQSIIHVKYVDENGVQQTLQAGTDYIAALRSTPAIILPPQGASWPRTQNWVDANGNYPVEIRFRCGYGTNGSAVPEIFKQAMLLLIGHWYENREEVIDINLTEVPNGARALLFQERFHPW